MSELKRNTQRESTKLKYCENSTEIFSKVQFGSARETPIMGFEPPTSR